jgi:hypothetical protein
VVVPQQCNVNLSLTENRISSLASFFGDSCKAGKWASDPKQDQLLSTCDSFSQGRLGSIPRFTKEIESVKKLRFITFFSRGLMEGYA